jgi:hypothetical protein
MNLRTFNFISVTNVVFTILLCAFIFLQDYFFPVKVLLCDKLRLAAPETYRENGSAVALT